MSMVKKIIEVSRDEEIKIRELAERYELSEESVIRSLINIGICNEKYDFEGIARIRPDGKFMIRH